MDDIGKQSNQVETKNQSTQYWIRILVVKLRESQKNNQKVLPLLCTSSPKTMLQTLFYSPIIPAPLGLSSRTCSQ